MFELNRGVWTLTGAVTHVIKKEIEVLNIRLEVRDAAMPPVGTTAV